MVCLETQLCLSHFSPDPLIAKHTKHSTSHQQLVTGVSLSDRTPPHTCNKHTCLHVLLVEAIIDIDFYCISVTVCPVSQDWIVRLMLAFGWDSTQTEFSVKINYVTDFQENPEVLKKVSYICNIGVKVLKVGILTFIPLHCRSGKPTYFSAVFNTLSPAIKQSWISNLQMAKLALGTVHCLAVHLHCLSFPLFFFHLICVCMHL